MEYTFLLRMQAITIRIGFVNNRFRASEILDKLLLLRSQSQKHIAPRLAMPNAGMQGNLVRTQLEPWSHVIRDILDQISDTGTRLSIPEIRAFNLIL